MAVEPRPVTCRLLTVVDIHGHFEAKTQIVVARLFPFSHSVILQRLVCISRVATLLQARGEVYVAEFAKATSESLPRAAYRTLLNGGFIPARNGLSGEAGVYSQALRPAAGPGRASACTGWRPPRPDNWRRPCWRRRPRCPISPRRRSTRSARAPWRGSPAG